VARLIGRRYDSRRVTIITTNMTGHEFKDAYGQRIADRVREAGVSRGFTERRRK
jgi:DNA replication protein DnaC